MLVNDDTRGQSGAKERDRLDAMLAVGNEFMTSADETSTIQRSGEFVRIDMEDEVETTPRFLLLHETSDVYQVGSDGSASILDDGDFYDLPPSTKVRQRPRLMLSRVDGDTGNDVEFKPLRSALDLVRMPRYTQITNAPSPRQFSALHESNYTALSGKRRLFPQPDGRVLVVRDVVERDGRYYYGQRKDSQGRVRSPRVVRIEVVELDERGKLGKAPVFSFPVHSGLGVDATGKVLSNAPLSTDASMPIVSESVVYGATAGTFWGEALTAGGSDQVPFGGDAGDTFAFCEPAIAPRPGGGTFTSMIAVYAADDDVHNPQSAGPYRLTCKRTTPDGGVVSSKITFQALPAYPRHYLAARGITLIRTSATTAMLRVFVHAMQSAVPGSLQSTQGDVLYYWTQDNGATWTYQPVIAGFPGYQTYGSLLVRDATTVLVFGAAASYPATVPVWAITPSGFSQIATIPYSVFAEGFMDPVSVARVPYLALGFGGVVYRKTAEGTRKRLWMQFDPRWVYEEGQSYVLEYPGSRPIIAVSDDNGATWSRRLLPTPWQFLAGFVVSVAPSILAAPVYAARREHGKPVKVTVYLSKDGGETWKATRAAGSVPTETRIDADIVIGEEIVGRNPDGTPNESTRRKSQDISDCWLEYNRGELHPLLVLRDLDGNPVHSNPARPWMVDANVKEPDHG